MNKIVRALNSEKRQKVLRWLRNPRAHFPEQRDGDLVDDGVCVVFIAEKLGVSQPTATEHMKVLHEAGLVVPKRIKTWTFYKRDEAGLEKARAIIMDQLS